MYNNNDPHETAKSYQRRAIRDREAIKKMVDDLPSFTSVPFPDDFPIFAVKTKVRVNAKLVLEMKSLTNGLAWPRSGHSKLRHVQIPDWKARRCSISVLRKTMPRATLHRSQLY